MKQRNKNCIRRAPLALAIATAALWTAPASAVEFEAGDWTGNWNTTLSIGSSWRAEGPDHALVPPGDGKAVGINDGRGGSTTGTGNLNYKRGDRYSTIAKFVTDVSLAKEGKGVLVRAKGWYDDELENGDVHYGNQANGYQKGRPLSDNGYEKLQRFRGVELLDAYVYGDFEVADMPLQARVGRQVVNWGESLFVPGINQINAFDVPALRRAGTEIKEALLPAGMVYGNLGVGNGRSVEAFYQFQRAVTPIDGCGSYWSVTEGMVGAEPGACTMAVALGATAPGSMAAPAAQVAAIKGRKSSHGGQGGLAMRFPVEALDTEFGIYAANIHSRTPIVSAFKNTAPAPVRPKAFWEYPEDIRIFALTATTTVKGWSVGSELSYSPNTPVQLNGADMVVGLVRGLGPLAGKAAATPAGGYFRGYDRYKKTQLQVNGVNLFSNVLGADSLTVAAEAVAQYNSVPGSDGSDPRYGRAFIYGFGSTPGLNMCAIPPAAGGNPQPDGCSNDGYVSKFAWGYRALGRLEYTSVMGTPLTVSPSLYLAHDVKGYSLDSQLNEGRVTVGTGLRFDYLKRHKVDLNYTTYGNDANYDPLHDRDNYSVSYSYTF